MQIAAPVFRLDRSPGSLGATPIEVTAEGYKVYRGVAAFGDVVLDYPELGRREYVPAAEALAPEIVATLVNVPFTIHHPEDLLSAERPDQIKEHIEGTVRAARGNMSTKPPQLEVEVVVWTAPAQDAIESGEVAELSPGYRCNEEAAAPGAIGPGGKPYTTIQRDRRYNHLSGVRRARGVTPDGRRARLDEADAYPLVTMPEMSPPDLSTMLTGISPEGAEILKSLPPVDLELLASMLAGVAAAPAPAAAPMPAIEVEIEGAGEGVAEPTEEEKAAAPEAEPMPEGDAAMPVAAGTITAKEVQDMLSAAMTDLCGKMRDMFGASKADAPPAPTAAPAPAPKADAAPASKADAAKVRADLEADLRSELAFVGEVMRCSGVRLDTYPDAAAKALSVIGEHAPALVPMAKLAADAKRRDDLLALFRTADDKRRDGLVGSQLSALSLLGEDVPLRDMSQGTGFIDLRSTRGAK